MSLQFPATTRTEKATLGIYKHLQRAINLFLKYTFETGMMSSLFNVPHFYPSMDEND